MPCLYGAVFTELLAERLPPYLWVCRSRGRRCELLTSQDGLICILDSNSFSRCQVITKKLKKAHVSVRGYLRLCCRWLNCLYSLDFTGEIKWLPEAGMRAL